MAKSRTKPSEGLKTRDQLAIYELYARYSWALDTGDTEGYLDLFTPNAKATEETSSGGIEVRQGRDEIRKLVLKFHERPDFPGHQHQMAQFVFAPDPDGRADHWEVRSYAWATINRPPEPPHLHWCGHVRDIVAKVDGKWLIASKEIMGWAGKVLERFQPPAASPKKSRAPRTTQPKAPAAKAPAAKPAAAKAAIKSRSKPKP